MLELIIIGQMMGQNARQHPHLVERHRTYNMGRIPKEYKGLKNPLKPTKENLAAGEKIWKEQCVACHGESGRGDGPAGKALNPPAADLAFIITRPIAQDDFLFWTISEGGLQFGTAMPAYKNILSEKQRWQVILYLRKKFTGTTQPPARMRHRMMHQRSN